MGNRARDLDKPWYQRWYGPHTGKWWKRRMHKAERAYIKGFGRLRSLAHYISTVNWKNS